MATIPPILEEAPELTEMAISGIDRNGHTVLGVVAKRTYVVAPDGRCEPARQQLPLNFGPVDDPDEPELILADTDILLDKLETDVVVRGHAWNHEYAPSYLCTVQVARHRAKRVRVFGEYLDAFAEVRFGHADRRIFLHEPNMMKLAEYFDRRALNGASLRPCCCFVIVR